MSRRSLLALIAGRGCGCGRAEPCVSVGTVNIQLFGDSTQKGIDGSTAPSYTLAAITPKLGLQAYFDSLLGAGAVNVTERAVSGSNAVAFVAGTDGLNSAWPAPATGHIVVFNFGINDSHDETRAAYKAALTTLCTPAAGRIAVLETPNYVLAPNDIADTVAAMREVALEQTVQLAELYDYGAAQSDIVSLMPDTTHPVSALYQRYMNNVLGPALAPIVAKLRCS